MAGQGRAALLALGSPVDHDRRMEEIPVRLPIKLSQFIKLANFAETGGHAHELIDAGEVCVNGIVERRRAHKLQPGDVVEVGGYTVAVGAS